MDKKDAIILKASAGTGKTYRISIEYLKLLLSGINLEEILVVTFTRKATAEIKERIFRLIERLDSNDAELLKELKLEKPVSKAEIKELHVNMVLNKDKLKIYTIDSYINSQFNRYIVPFYNLYDYKIIDSDKNSEYLYHVLEKVIQKDSNFSKLNEFFNKFMEKDVTIYVNWIEELIENRWKFLLLGDVQKKQPLPKGDLNKSFEEVLSSIETIVKTKKKEVKLSDVIKDNFKPALDSSLRKEFFENNSELFFALDSETGFWHKTKLRKTQKNSAQFSQLNKAYAKFQRILACQVYNKEILHLESNIFKLSEVIFKEYDLLKFKNREFTYNDILTYSYIFLIGDSRQQFGAVKINELAGVKYMLIDEFQDTSILQWKILKKIVEDSHKVIIVGDEKQAIYSWRGGEKKLFERLTNILEAEQEELDLSYRSEREIIEFCNNFFLHLGIFKNNKVRHLKENKHGYVDIRSGDQNEIKEEIAKTIKRKITQYSKCAILARTNRELEEIAISLKEQNLPYIKESSLSIIENSAVKPIHAFLKYMVNDNYLELLKFLRSNLINIDDRLMKVLLKNKENVIAFLNIEKAEFTGLNFEIPYPLKKAFIRIRYIKGLPQSDIVKAVMESFAVLSINSDVYDIKNLNKFYALSRQFKDVSLFLKYLDENKHSEELKQENIEESNAIRLMTIHKAKGLEFETVFFYWHVSPRSVGIDKKTNFFLNFTDNFDKIEDYCFTSNNYSKILKYLGLNFKASEKEKMIHEEINNLYVGMTRAKKNLFLRISYGKNIESLNELLIKGYRSDSEQFYHIFTSALMKTIALPFKDFFNKGYSKGRFFETVNKNLMQLPKNTSYNSEIVNFFKYKANLSKIENNIVTVNEAEDLKKVVLEKVTLYYLSFIKYGNEEETRMAKQLTVQNFGSYFNKDELASVIGTLNKFVINNLNIFGKKSSTILTNFNLSIDGIEYRFPRLIIDEKVKEIRCINVSVDSELFDNSFKKGEEALRLKFKEEYDIIVSNLNINFKNN